MPRSFFLVLFCFLCCNPLGAQQIKPPEGFMLKLSEEQATKFAGLALKNIHREYPNKPGNVLESARDILSPKQLYPAFYGCYDWHSSVHGHWMLVKILKEYPQLREAGEIRKALAKNITKENLLAEAAFFLKPESKSFERPYGWSWFLKLALELHSWEDPLGKELAQHLKPLEEIIVGRYISYFPKQTYPIRSGVHSNTAFGLAYALDYSRQMKNKELEQLIVKRARDYYFQDEMIPAKWEPDGADFFSPSLMEADLMRRILPQKEFSIWLDKFYPNLLQNEPASLFNPAVVSDRTDPQIVHLDGLNLSRAWCMKNIGLSLSEGDPRRMILLESAKKHATASLGHVSSGDYAGEHWLASFAINLLCK